MTASSQRLLRTLMAVCLTATAARGQVARVIRGVVTDTGDHPVPSASIQLAGSRTATTDDSGRFRLEVTHSNKVTFDIRRVGYMPSRFGLSAGGDTSVSIMLLPSAQQMARVDIIAAEVNRALETSGFTQRRLERTRGTNTGFFVTAADIDKRNPPRLTQMFDQLPGLITCRTKDGAVCGLLGSHMGMTTGARGDKIVPCAITVYLDNVRLNTAERMTADRINSAVDIDAFVVPSSVAGFEYYPNGNRIPDKFQLLTGSCGLVLIWTKRR